MKFTGEISLVPLHLFSLRFRSSEMEEKYQVVNFKRSINLFRWAVLLSIFLHVLYIYLDWLVLNDNFIVMWNIRSLILIPGSIAVLLLSYHSNFLRYMESLTSVALLINGFAMAYASYSFGDDLTIMYAIPGTIMVLMYAYILLGLRFLVAASVSWVIVIVHVATVVWLVEPQQGIIILAIESLIMSSAILMVGAYRTEYLARKGFYLSIKKREEDKSNIVWLENLRYFFKHELLGVLRGVELSINNLVEYQDIGTDNKQLVRVRTGLETIHNLIVNTSKGTGLEASLQNEVRDLVDIVDVLNYCIESYSELEPDVEIECDKRSDSLFVLGRRERIQEIIDNLLKNAVEHHYPLTPIQIVLKKTSDKIALLVTNRGPKLPEARENIFNLFASYRNNSRSAKNSGIGLYVVRVIVAAYGGSVDAFNLSDDNGVTFKVVLPAYQQRIN